MEERRKKNTLLEDFAVAPKGQLKVRTCSKNQQELKCLCQELDEVGHCCFKCGVFVHHCLEKINNRGDLFECASCLNAAMDPLFKVHKVFVESYFNIQSIFQCLNQITFEFVVGSDDLFRPVEIRALKPGQTSLNYPMLGIFQLNQQFMEELRPLKSNSNRKSRREQFIVIPKERVKIGKNLLRFKIPVIDKLTFRDHYQYEEHATYYFSINSIQQIKKEALIKETFATRRLEKPQSVALLTKQSGDVQITQTKFCLICPYTKERIKIPVRGKYCKHFNCICLETLIAYHMKSRFWGCPLCDNKITEPFIDIWIYTMLAENKRGNDVLVQADGTYRWISGQNQAVSLESQADMKEINKNDADHTPLFNPMVRSPPQNMFYQSLQQEEALGLDRLQLGQANQQAEYNRKQQREQLRKELSTKLSNIKLNNQTEEAKWRGGWDRDNMLKIPVIIKDVKELRVKEQSYTSFRKKNLQNQLGLIKKMEEFVEEHPNLRSLFKEALS